MWEHQFSVVSMPNVLHIEKCRCVDVSFLLILIIIIVVVVVVVVVPIGNTPF
jgi:hypothetical protein